MFDPVARALCLTLLVSACLLPSGAAAYEVYTTETGETLWWDQPCVSWWVHAGADPYLQDPIPEAVTLEALEDWATVPELGVNFRFMGPTCFGEPGLDPVAGPQNVLLWMSEKNSWTASHQVMALTYLTYDDNTGQILDADIAFNAEGYDFGVDGEPHALDLKQVLLHELGHTLGLDHSGDPDAVMHAKAKPGETHKRSLSADDIAAAQATHPGPLVADGLCEPHRVPADAPLEVHCDAVPGAVGESGACSGSAGASPPVWMWCLGLVLFGTMGRRSRGLLLLGLLLGPLSMAKAGTIYLTPDGDPLHWTRDEVAFVLDPDGPADLSAEELQTSFELGVHPWNLVDCVDPELSVTTVDHCPGEVIDDGVNCVIWIHQPELWRWPSHLVAITLVHYQGDTGEIQDVDMEFNGAHNTWSVTQECNDEDHDLWATVTHEMGHVLGLDHNNHPQATMNAVTFPGDCKKRTLHAVDEETVCELYDSLPAVAEPVDADTLDATNRSGDAGGGGQEPGSAPDDPHCQGGGADAVPTWVILCGLVAIGRSRRGARRAPVH